MADTGTAAATRVQLEQHFGAGLPADVVTEGGHTYEIVYAIHTAAY